MPIRINGSSVSPPTNAHLHMFAVLSLTEKREKHQSQQNILRLLLFVLMMTSLGMKAALTIPCLLLFLAIGLVIYSLHQEAENLRVIQTQLIELVRNTPASVLNEMLNSENETDE